MKTILLILTGVSLLFGAYTRDSTAQAVYDDQTSLTWMDDINVSSQEKTWFDALDYCENLEYAGQNDWRLPNYNELESISDARYYNPAIYQNGRDGGTNNGFVYTASYGYWSATTSARNTIAAWVVYFFDAGVYAFHKGVNHYVRCVRSGQLNTSPFVTSNTGSTVLESGTDTITSAELEFDDDSSPDTEITYTVTTLPANGTLQRNGSDIALNGTFTQGDINNSLVTYVHDGSDTTTDHFDFNVTDGDGATNSGNTFNFTITSVNDKPTVAIGGNQSAGAGTGGVIQTVNSFASMSDDGDSNEVQGIADFIVSEASDPDSVVTSVDIANNGTLTYTPANNASGTATISVQVQDDGGTANGGADTSDAKQFTITVDTKAPNLSEVTAVITPTSDTTPAYTFSTSEAGTLAVGGSCGSASEGSVTASNHTIQFTRPDNTTALNDGTYSDCTLTVTDTAGNGSSALTASSFTVDTTAPSGYSVEFDDAEINATETATSTFTFSGAEVGATYHYTVTSSRGGTAVSGNGTVSAAQTGTLADLAGLNDGTLTLSVTLTDKAGNQGSAATDTTLLNAVNEGIGVTETDNTTSESTTDNNATFNVVLLSKPIADVNVTMLTTDNSEGEVSTPASKILTFTPANWNQAQPVTVTGVNDDIDDGNIPYDINLTASSTDSEYNGKKAQVNLSNSDDDSAGITVTTTDDTTAENGEMAALTVVLNTEPVDDVTVTIASDDTSEGIVSTPASKTLTFTSGDWNISQDVNVTGVDDFIVDGTVDYNITFTAASTGDGIYNGMSKKALLHNEDNDSAGLNVSTPTTTVTTEAGGSATFTLSLNSQPGADVNITLSSSDTTEGSVNPTTVIFTPANWNAPQVVTVTGVDDGSVDGTIAYSVTMVTSSTDADYQGLTKTENFTNADDDSPPAPEPTPTPPESDPTLPQTDLSQEATGYDPCGVEMSVDDEGITTLQVYVGQEDSTVCLANTLTHGPGSSSITTDEGAAAFFEEEGGVSHVVILHPNGTTEVNTTVLDEAGNPLNTKIESLFIGTFTTINEEGNVTLSIESAEGVHTTFTSHNDGTLSVSVEQTGEDGNVVESCIKVNVPNSTARIESDGTTTITFTESITSSVNGEEHTAELTVAITITPEGVITLKSVQVDPETGVRTVVNTLASGEPVPAGSCMVIDSAKSVIHHINKSHVRF